jgi:hypothetical protein
MVWLLAVGVNIINGETVSTAYYYDKAVIGANRVSMLGHLFAFEIDQAKN